MKDIITIETDIVRVEYNYERHHNDRKLVLNTIMNDIITIENNFGSVEYYYERHHNYRKRHR